MYFFAHDCISKYLTSKTKSHLYKEVGRSRVAKIYLTSYVDISQGILAFGNLILDKQGHRARKLKLIQFVFVVFSVVSSFIWLLMARSLQGIASSCIAVAGMGMIAKMYDEDQAKYIY